MVRKFPHLHARPEGIPSARSLCARLHLAGLLSLACSPTEDFEDSGLNDDSPPLTPNHGTLPEFCSDPTVTVEAGSMWEVTGDHYQLRVGTTWTETEAETLGRLLESAWPAFADYFGAPAAAPGGGLLEVWVFDTETEWATAIETDGIEVPWGAGGLFHTSSSRAYLWRQPEDYTNRMLLVHEAAHQFHHLSVTTTAATGWFMEGVAGYLERHDWYDGCMRLGVVPTGTLEDYHETAWLNWSAGTLNLENFIAGDHFSRPESMALWAYLEEEQSDAFQEFRDAVDAGESGEAEAFATHLGPPESHLEPLVDWLDGHQEPFEVVYTGWRHIDQDHIAVHASGLVFAPLKQTPAHFSTTVLPQASTFSAGVLTSFEDWSQWSVVVADQDGGVAALHLGGDGAIWDTLESLTPAETLEFNYTVDDEVTSLEINGEAQDYAHGQEGAAGLGAYDSAVVFELIPIEQ